MSVQQFWPENDGIIVFPSVGNAPAGGEVPAGTAKRDFKRWMVLDTQFENVIIFNNAGSVDVAPEPEVTVSTAVGDGEFLSWKDSLEAQFRKKHLEKILAKAKREDAKLAKKEKQLEKKLQAKKKSPQMEGILSEYAEISFKREEIKTEIRNVEKEYEALAWFLTKLEEEDEEDIEMLLL